MRLRSPHPSTITAACCCGCIALWLGLLTGCATLPDVRDLQRSAAPPGEPSIVTARGALPPQKAQALIDGMAGRVGPTGILQQHVAAEEAISGRPLVAGNKVTLLDDGPATMRAMMDAIRAARDHVNLETYIIEADEVGQALADLLMRKSADGVVVNLIYDSVGSLRTPREFFTRLEQAGVAVLEYHPVNPLQARGRWDLNQRDHRKILVVDGRTAFTGGVNISEVYGRSSAPSRRRGEPPPQDAERAAWRDTHMQIDGPAAAEFQRLFLATWQRKTGGARTTFRRCSAPAMRWCARSAARPTMPTTACTRPTSRR